MIHVRRAVRIFLWAERQLLIKFAKGFHRACYAYRCDLFFGIKGDDLIKQPDPPTPQRKCPDSAFATGVILPFRGARVERGTRRFYEPDMTEFLGTPALSSTRFITRSYQKEKPAQHKKRVEGKACYAGEDKKGNFLAYTDPTFKVYCQLF